MTTTTGEILTERTDAALRVTFNRPDTLNALTPGMLTGAAEAIETGASDSQVRAIMLTGAGRAFSAGADLGDGAGEPTTDTIEAANAVIMAIRRAPKPVVAAVNGPAVGVGCSFALAADITIATASAYFLLAFANIGLMPDGGATALIPATIGRARALRMAMLAERIPATQAADWGMIAEAAPDDEFDSAVDGLITRLAAGPTQSYALSKCAINATTLTQLAQALETERTGQAQLFDSKDFDEGVAAFRDKRPARFTGQ